MTINSVKYRRNYLGHRMLIFQSENHSSASAGKNVDEQNKVICLWLVSEFDKHKKDLNE